MILETRHSIQEILSRQPLFRGLSDEELRDIASGAREYRVKKNEMLFHRGDPVEGMHVLVMGQVKLSLPSSQGAEKVVHVCGPGHTFGEAVVFLDKPYPVNAQATAESLLLLIPKRSLLDALAQSNMLCRKMIASLSARLHEMISDMETCLLRNSVQRVVCFLVQSASESGQTFEVGLPASKQTIASQLNLAPETFSRVLGQLTEAGLIEVKGRRITVRDRQRLIAFSG